MHDTKGTWAAMIDRDETSAGSRVGRLLEAAREARGLSRAAAQSELGWPGKRPGDVVNNLERIVRMPRLDAALQYANLLGVPYEEVAEAVGVTREPERTSSALVVEHVLAASGWSVDRLAAILGVPVGTVEAWLSGEERIPGDAAKRLLLVVPIRLEVAADLDAQADGLRSRRLSHPQADDVSARATSSSAPRERKSRRDDA